MKRITAIIIATACILGSAWEVHADTITVEAPVFNSVDLCNEGRQAYADNVQLGTVIEWLNHSSLDLEDKSVFLECFIDEGRKL